MDDNLRSYQVCGSPKRALLLAGTEMGVFQGNHRTGAGRDNVASTESLNLGTFVENVLLVGRRSGGAGQAHEPGHKGKDGIHGLFVLSCD